MDFNTNLLKCGEDNANQHVMQYRTMCLFVSKGLGIHNSMDSLIIHRLDRVFIFFFLQSK